AISSGAITPDQLPLLGCSGVSQQEQFLHCGMPIHLVWLARPPCGSPTLADNFLPSYTATSVRRLLDEGAWLLARLTWIRSGWGLAALMVCTGLQSPSPTPQSPCSSSSDAPDSATNFYIAGGSSGGSAAAVASGLAVGALASDTGGSSRNPGGFLRQLWTEADLRPGVPSRSGAAGERAGLRVYHGQHASEPVGWSDKLAAGLKIGVARGFQLPHVSLSPGHVSRAVTHLESDWPDLPTSVSAAYSAVHQSLLVLCCAEGGSNMARYDGIEFGLRVRDSENSVESLYTANRLAGFNSAYYEQARKVWRLIKEDFDRVFQSVNLLVCPAAVTAAPTYRDFVQADNRYRTSTMDLCTQSVNLAGLPLLCCQHRAGGGHRPAAGCFK
uniref:Amidase domain-containing protein n=1 Tax=Macrostomum lignano TaxID=282301 RepID=A0A1I8I9C6_9PLAT